ncbi:MAG: iron-sulfur cluster assembly accessory protein [Pseudomonadota bacterium]|nr:iron-sulfur cluster assembly accessory protein [Pseudomonadota bacterium]
MTEAAVRHVMNQIERRGSGIGVRLGIKKMGCSGFGYQVDFIDEAGEDDREYPVTEGLSVYVDPQALPYVKGTQLDYVREGLNATFKFINPNVQDTCGCGESFSV